MKIYASLSQFKKLENAVVTTGTFDGVHFGHKKILEKVLKLAKDTQGESVVITFNPHPRLVLQPDDNQLRLLNTFEEKIKLMSEMGIDHLFFIPFTKEFSRLSSDEFVKDILVDIVGTKTLVIGYDHQFGKNREGNFQNLNDLAPQYGFKVEEISKQDIDDVAVSSTKIRKALASHDIDTATAFLTYPYRLLGTVIPENQFGRTIDYPTANILVEDPLKIIPAEGIYAVKARIIDSQTTHFGMLYIGKRPTINPTHQSIELHIFDFNQEIYGNQIEVEFLKFIREDKQLESIEALKAELKKDELACRAFFKI
jgi:riboflavin kinase / FMN adenylyltransferase